MFKYVRTVRFEDIDGAGIVFFPRYLSYCHEAMEAFFGALEGGYVRLICERKIGFPAVDVHVSYRSPLRYGDEATIAVEVLKLGNRSTTFRYSIAVGERAVAMIEHTCAVCDLVALKSIQIPGDLRSHLEAHLVSG